MKAAHTQRAAGVSDGPKDPLAEEPAAGDVESTYPLAEEPAGFEDRRAAAEELLKENAFPTLMMVPGRDGTPVEVKLSVLDGVVYAAALDSLPLDPRVRQYVLQFCAAWSQSWLTTGKIQASWPLLDPPRRAQLVFTESQLHAMLGLGGDEAIAAVVVDPLSSTVRFVVDSPRLAPKQWNTEPPVIGLPVSAWYEGRQGDGDSRGAAGALRQLQALRARALSSALEWSAAIENAQRRVAVAQQAEGQVQS